MGFPRYSLWGERRRAPWGQQGLRGDPSLPHHVPQDRHPTAPPPRTMPRRVPSLKALGHRTPVLQPRAWCHPSVTHASAAPCT